MASRLFFIGFVLLGLFALIALRLFWLQAWMGSEYDRDVQEARNIDERIPAQRGRILDRTGLVLADSGTTWHAAVILADLELSGRHRRNAQFYQLDSQALGRICVDLASRLRRPPEEIRLILLNELESSPSTAKRLGPPHEKVQISLLALPASLLEPSASENTDDPFRANLAQNRFVFEDPAQALQWECSERLGTQVWVGSAPAWRNGFARLGRRLNIESNALYGAARPILSEISVPDPDGDTATAKFPFLILESSRLNLLAQILAPLNCDPTLFTEAFLNDPPPHAMQTSGPWLYLPPSALKFIPPIPQHIAVKTLMIEGAPLKRERMYLVQDDLPGYDPQGQGLGSLFFHRLEASLGGVNADWLASLFHQYAQRVGIAHSERTFRQRLMLLDAQKIRRLINDLSQALTAGDKPTSPLQVAQSLAQARTIADRQWRGSSRNDPIVLESFLSHPLALRLASQVGRIDQTLAKEWQPEGRNFPGLTILERSQRRHRFPTSMPHLLGWLGSMGNAFDPAKAREFGLDPQGEKGITGLEAEYDELLQGVSGRRVGLKTPDGFKILSESTPVAGKDLNISLDADLQRIAEDSLDRWPELAEGLNLLTPKMKHAATLPRRGGLVLMDPASGEVLALATHPRFHIDSITRDYGKLIDKDLFPNEPLLDYSVVPIAPTGSSQKVLTAIAGLTEDVLQPGENIYSPGYMASYKGRKVLSEHSPFSPRSFDVVDAMAKSSNVFFATVGARLGGERLSFWQSRMGMGHNNALDIGWQRPGLLPSPSNLHRLSPQEPKWTPYRSWSQAIGQGMTASPIQMVCVAAFVANGGTIVRPWLSPIAPKSASAPETVVLDPENLTEVRRGMEAVTETGGTASKLHVRVGGLSIKVAAKTGTAEWGSPESRHAGRTPDHAWLIGYAPADNPRIAFAIFIHAGTSGGGATTGIAKALLEAYFRKYPDGHHLGDPSAPGALSNTDQLQTKY
jgi:penicillin-binding protein 2